MDAAVHVPPKQTGLTHNFLSSGRAITPWPSPPTLPLGKVRSRSNRPRSSREYTSLKNSSLILLHAHAVEFELYECVGSRAFDRIRLWFLVLWFQVFNIMKEKGSCVNGDFRDFLLSGFRCRMLQFVAHVFFGVLFQAKWSWRPMSDPCDSRASVLTSLLEVW